MAAIATNLSLAWNRKAQCWVVDIADSAGNPLVQGIALVCGSDLLEQLGYLGLGGALLAQTDNSPDTPPTYANLGDSSHVYFLSDPVK